MKLPQVPQKNATPQQALLSFTIVFGGWFDRPPPAVTVKHSNGHTLPEVDEHGSAHDHGSEGMNMFRIPIRLSTSDFKDQHVGCSMEVLVAVRCYDPSLT